MSLQLASILVAVALVALARDHVKRRRAERRLRAIGAVAAKGRGPVDVARFAAAE